MQQWLVYSVISLCIWGIWGVLGKIASQHMADKNFIILSVFGGALLIPFYLYLCHKHIIFKWDSIPYYVAILTGIFGSLGGIFFYFALSAGQASKVVVITSLYPILTVTASYFILHESLSLLKIIGCLCATIGIVLLSL